MTLDDKDKAYIRFLFEEIDKANRFNNKDYWRATFRHIDNIPRATVIKMLADLCDYFDLEEAQE